MSITGYKVKVWCSDCFGIDSYGCFGGSYIYISDDNNLLEDNVFPTKEAAKRAAEDYCDNGMYEYELIPV